MSNLDPSALRHDLGAAGPRPARSKLEAVLRISSLTHRPPAALGPGSKERRSVLSNLAKDLGLAVDFSATKHELGTQIAAELGVSWENACWSAGQTITLTGLNRLLSAAEQEVARRRHAPQLPLFETVQQVSREHVPARSKLEAVTRISALTQSPPETLGPGSKERKSALVNLARGLELSVDTAAPKPELGAAIAAELRVTWGQDCWSAGHTITLTGLDRLLGGAESVLMRGRGSTDGLFFSAKEEACALLNALRTVISRRLDGRACVAEMHAAEYSQWAQDEWAAFYFEFVGLPTLVNTFGGGPRKFGNTRFDYALGHTWDMKVHMAVSGVAPLNDCVAMDEALDSGSGVGFLILTGQVEYDDGDFREWQREFRSQQGKVAKVRTEPAKYVRKSKPAFQPQMLEAFYLPDAEALGTAVENGSIRVMKQGRQTSGKDRRPKYAIDLVKARFHGLMLSQVIL